MKKDFLCNDEYTDIINESRPYSLCHMPMSLSERAAQFAPFSALSGYEKELIKAEEIKTERILRFDESIGDINRKIKILKENMNLKPKINIVFFEHTEDSGLGEYKKESVKLEKVEDFEKRIVFENGLTVNFEDIYSLEGEIFNNIGLL